MPTESPEERIAKLEVRTENQGESIGKIENKIDKGFENIGQKIDELGNGLHRKVNQNTIDITKNKTNLKLVGFMLVALPPICLLLIKVWEMIQ